MQLEQDHLRQFGIEIAGGADMPERESRRVPLPGGDEIPPTVSLNAENDTLHEQDINVAHVEDDPTEISRDFLQEAINEGLLPQTVSQAVKEITDEEKRMIYAHKVSEIGSKLIDEGMLAVNDDRVQEFLDTITPSGDMSLDYTRAVVQAGNDARFDQADYQTLPVELFTDPKTNTYPSTLYEDPEAIGVLIKGAKAAQQQYGQNKALNRSFAPSVHQWYTKDHRDLALQYAEDTVQTMNLHQRLQISGSTVEVKTPMVDSTIGTFIDLLHTPEREGLIAQSFRLNPEGERVICGHITFKAVQAEGKPGLQIGEIQPTHSATRVQQDNERKIRKMLQPNKDDVRGSEHLEFMIGGVVELALKSGQIQPDSPITFTHPHELYWLDFERSHGRTHEILGKLKEKNILETTEEGAIIRSEANLQKFAEYCQVDAQELKLILDKAKIYSEGSTRVYGDEYTIAIDMLGTHAPEYRNGPAKMYPGYPEEVFPGLASYDNPPTAIQILQDMHERIMAVEARKIRTNVKDPAEAERKIAEFVAQYRTEHLNFSLSETT